MRNGETFQVLVDREEIVSGKWNPFYYQSFQDHNADQNYLWEFIIPKKVTGQKISQSKLKFGPIEYKSISAQTNSLVFGLNNELKAGSKYTCVSEQSLLLGTMRAYLGNVCVTPKFDWLDNTSIKSRNVRLFAINSEFVALKPLDGLVYFWWAFFKQKNVLSKLPSGSGGTRPRLDIDLLKNLLIDVPSLETRTRIHNSLLTLAESEWKQSSVVHQLIQDCSKDNLNNADITTGITKS